MDSFTPTTGSTVNAEPTPHREYKSRLFAMLFSDKEKLLELYNAMAKTHYTDPDALQINTLENAIYMSMHNDLSFIIDSRVCLYEHQSTYSPNLPLRGLFYISDLYSGMINHAKLYGTTPVRVPTPQFVVFYNGLKKVDDICYLRLSDLVTVPNDPYALDLVMLMININAGHNKELLETCKTLGDYAIYVARVRKHAKEMPIASAVERAISECIAEDVLAEFLTKNRAEAKKMSIYEYDEEAVKKVWQDEAFAEGVSIGKQEGVALGRQEERSLMNQLYEYLLDAGRIDDMKRSFADDDFCNQLLQEFSLLSKQQ